MGKRRPMGRHDFLQQVPTDPRPLLPAQHIVLPPLFTGGPLPWPACTVSGWDCYCLENYSAPPAFQLSQSSPVPGAALWASSREMGTGGSCSWAGALYWGLWECGAQSMEPMFSGAVGAQSLGGLGCITQGFLQLTCSSQDSCTIRGKPCMMEPGAFPTLSPHVAPEIAPEVMENPT